VGEFTLSDAQLINASTIDESERVDWTPHDIARTEGGAARPSLPHRLIRRLDAALRRFYGIHEFSDRPDCLLRISVARSECDARLADGTAICRGAEILELHLWNEHLPSLEALSVGLGRLNALRGLIALSLYELADHLAAEPRLDRIVAVRARAALVSGSRTMKLLTVARTYGFERADYVAGEGFWRRVHAFCENFLICALTWTFNPAALRGNRLLRTRCELWVARETFIARYGPGSPERRRELDPPRSGAMEHCDTRDDGSRRIADAARIVA
jgi:hypothetical protein